MVEMRPVRVSKLIRYALLMTDLAGLTINAEFSKILDDPGAGLLVLTIDFSPRALRARLDNFASNDVGPLELAGNARFNNAFGFFEWTDGLVVTNPARSGGTRRRQAGAVCPARTEPASPPATTTPTSGPIPTNGGRPPSTPRPRQTNLYLNYASSAPSSAT